MASKRYREQEARKKKDQKHHSPDRGPATRLKRSTLGQEKIKAVLGTFS